jgi:hypothetical protein
MAKVSRSQVYAAIDVERDYQDERYPLFEGTSASPEGFLLVIEELAEQARSAWVFAQTPKDKDVALDFIRKIAATGVRAMEQHGIVPRVYVKTATA